MVRMLRSSALSLVLGYIALGITALVLFAAPLWYAWQVTIQESRVEILQVDAQRLAEVFRREGAEGARSFIDARVRMQIAAERASRARELQGQGRIGRPGHANGLGARRHSGQLPPAGGQGQCAVCAPANALLVRFGRR